MIWSMILLVTLLSEQFPIWQNFRSLPHRALMSKTWRMKKYVCTAKEYKTLVHSCIKYCWRWLSPFKWNKKGIFYGFICLYGTHQLWNFRIKINCEKPLCTGIASGFFANDSIFLSVDISVGLSYCIDTCYAKVIQASNILFRKSNNFDLQNKLSLQFLFHQIQKLIPFFWWVDGQKWWLWWPHKVWRRVSQFFVLIILPKRFPFLILFTNRLLQV